MVILATIVFLALRHKFSASPYWKTVNSLLFACWIAVIFLGTLGQRTEGSGSAEPLLIPFYSYYLTLHGGNPELYRSNFMNAVLFYPAGLLSFDILSPKWKSGQKILLVAFIFTLLSICIEFTQYHFSMGLAEADDVIHNTLGALLGMLACCGPRNAKQND